MAPVVAELETKTKNSRRKTVSNNRPEGPKPSRGKAARQPRPKRLRRDQAVEVIRRMILAGKPGFKSGDTLNEPDLIKQLGLTKAPIRQALSQLAGEGLVAIKPRVGTHVRVVRPEEAQAMMALRFAIETIVVGELARGQPDLSPLKAIHEKMEEIASSHAQECDADAMAAFISADMDFHAAMAELADGYGGAARTVRDLTSQFILYTNRNIRLAAAPAVMKEVIKEHRLILDALARGESDEAREHLHTHLKSAVQRFASFAAPYLNDHLRRYIKMATVSEN
jgi:DNA-binding GntR family transcriptional regulator